MFAQLIANSILAAAYISLTAVGFIIIYKATHFFHFAHGIVFAIGAYSVYQFHGVLGLPFVASIPMAAVLSGFIGYLMERLVYRPLRQRGANGLVLLISSIGLYTIIQNTCSLLFGDGTQVIRRSSVGTTISIFGALLSWTQLISVLAAVFLLSVVESINRFSSIGISLRALSCDPSLAAIVGVDRDRVISIAFLIGSTLAGAGGILYALDMNMTPTMGMSALMLAIVAAIIGGSINTWAIAGGAVLLSLGQQLGTWIFGGEWRDAVAFLLLLSFLMIRNRGLGGTANPSVNM